MKQSILLSLFLSCVTGYALPAAEGGADSGASHLHHMYEQYKKYKHEGILIAQSEMQRSRDPRLTSLRLSPQEGAYRAAKAVFMNLAPVAFKEENFFLCLLLLRTAAYSLYPYWDKNIFASDRDASDIKARAQCFQKVKSASIYIFHDNKENRRLFASPWRNVPQVFFETPLQESLERELRINDLLQGEEARHVRNRAIEVREHCLSFFLKDMTTAAINAIKDRKFLKELLSATIFLSFLPNADQYKDKLACIFKCLLHRQKEVSPCMSDCDVLRSLTIHLPDSIQALQQPAPYSAAATRHDYAKACWKNMSHLFESFIIRALSSSSSTSSASSALELIEIRLPDFLYAEFTTIYWNSLSLLTDPPRERRGEKRKHSSPPQPLRTPEASTPPAGAGAGAGAGSTPATSRTPRSPEGDDNRGGKRRRTAPEEGDSSSEESDNESHDEDEVGEYPYTLDEEYQYYKTVKKSDDFMTSEEIASKARAGNVFLLVEIADKLYPTLKPPTTSSDSETMSKIKLYHALIMEAFHFLNPEEIEKYASVATAESLYDIAASMHDTSQFTWKEENREKLLMIMKECEKKTGKGATYNYHQSFNIYWGRFTRE